MFLIAASSLLALATLGNACMCMPSHPQEELCAENSFAALVKIRSEDYINIVNVPEPDQLFETPANLETIIAKQDESNEVELEAENSIIPTASSDEVVLKKKDEDIKAEYIRYRIKLYKAYKGVDSRTANLEKFYIYTALDDSMCGRKLTVKGTYLIIGTIMDGRLTIGLCNHVIQWKSLPKAEKRNIRENLLATKTVCDQGCNVTSCLWSDCSAESQSECTWNSKMEREYGRNYDRANFLCVPGARNTCEWSGVEIAQIEKKAEKRIQRRRRHSKLGYRGMHVAEKVRIMP